jgi:hypothetical protein
MKFFETHFEEYLNETNKVNLHPKLEKIYQQFPTSISKLRNLLFFGPSGVGKYTQVLKAIKRYSPSELKYEKKLSITYNKHQYFFKISDIHYEIDMSLLGCNSKLLWHEIYQQIIDIISTKTEKSGIIVCKYFHDIHSELLDNFYSYMQQNTSQSIDLKFILLTEGISFIPESIVNCCQIVNVCRPTKGAYVKCIQTKMPSQITLENITNIKLIPTNNEELMLHHKITCNKLVNCIVNIQTLNFLKFRDIIYDIFIYNIDIMECVWYILSVLVKDNRLKDEHLPSVLIKTYSFFKYYNNNYRPIYHVENYLLYLAKTIHNL